jgi:transcriptional regulator with XRE-family HTH domain
MLLEGCGTSPVLMLGKRCSHTWRAANPGWPRDGSKPASSLEKQQAYSNERPEGVGEYMSKTLAQKVDWLFNTRRNAQGRQFTYGQVQRATGNRITASYVWKLRTGAMSNPGLSALEALASFFEVPLDYFAEGGEYLEPSLSVVKMPLEDKVAREDAIQLVKEGASKLPDDKLRAVIEVVEYLRAHEEAAKI